MTESKDVKEMSTDFYTKLVKPKKEYKPRKTSMRDYFIMCYVKESIYRDMIPFELTRGSIDDIANLAAQLTYKLVSDEQKNSIETAYEAMSEQELEHLQGL